MFAPLIWLAMAGQQGGSGEAPTEGRWLTVRLEFIRCSDDDGRRACDFNPADAVRLIEIANRVYAPAKVRFVFNERRDFVAIRNSAVNSLDVVKSPLADRGAIEANKLVSKYHGKLVVLCRYGASKSPTGTGFSGGDQYAVFMPSLRHTNAGPWILAHEMGHYFGLSHTFRTRMRSIAQAEEVLKAHGGDLSVFDGDGFSDTAPDPGIAPSKEGPRDSLLLNGVKVLIPYGNIMSYMNWPGHEWLSEQQIARVRQVCEIRQGVGMGWQSNEIAAGMLQAEDLDPAYAGGCTGEVQQMTRFNKHRWSGGAQLFCHSPAFGSVTLHFQVERDSVANLTAYMTLGRDYGIVRFRLDGIRVGRDFDGFALGIVSSGPLFLGRQLLAGGEHSLKVEMIGKNPSSRDTSFGIDGITITDSDTPRATG